MSEEYPPQEISFWEHINDLRLHLLCGGLFFVIIAITLFSLGNQTLEYILKPMNGKSLVFLTPLEPVLFQMNIAFLGAFIFSLPIWLLLIAHFIGTALSKSQRLPFYFLTFTSFLFGIISVALTYKFVVPMSLTALSKFVIPGTTFMITANSYISFFMLAVIIIFIILELPIFIIALSYLRLVNPYYIALKRRYFILGLIILLAMATPTTDIVTLIIVAIPTILLAEIGVFISKIVYNKKHDE